MKNLRIVNLLFVMVILSTGIFALDYKIDTTFNPDFPRVPLSDVDDVYDVMVQNDGKIIAVGGFTQVNSAPATFLVRLNSDGTTDPTFSSAVTSTGSTSHYVNKIYALPGGQMLILGQFRIGTQNTTYARLNANGSVDTTLPVGLFQTPLMVPLPDGKYFSCSSRTVGKITYNVAHRLNHDGSVDPSFRITALTGFCVAPAILPDGKVLIGGSSLVSDGMPAKPLHRFNTDGSLDSTFNAALLEGTRVGDLVVLPDGKILALNSGNASSLQNYVRKLNSDGSLDKNIPECRSGREFLVMPDNYVMLQGCDQVTASSTYSKFARLTPETKVDHTLDYIYFSNSINGFRNDGNNLYVFGEFLLVGLQTNERRYLVRLVPNLDPPKAKYDFDGDGKSDVAVYRPSNGYWYLFQSTAGMSFVQWGLPGDVPAAMQFDTDGKTDIGVFRTGVYHMNTSMTGYKVAGFAGVAGDRPAMGEFDNTNNFGREDIMTLGMRDGVMKWLADQQYVAAGQLATDKPIIGDFNADARDDIGYFRDGYWFTQEREPWTVYLYQTEQWGIAGDIPVPADYDGDRQTDYAVFRPSTGVWWVKLSTGGHMAGAFGLNGDIPVPADYDGDGKADIAIFRNGDWWRYLSASGTVDVVNWGTTGDIPIPAQLQ